MLYQLHELQRSLLSPFAKWSQANATLFSDPVSPWAYTPFSQRIAAGYELLHRLGKDYEKPAFNIVSTTINETGIPITEEIIEDKAFCRLLHFKKETSDGAMFTQPTVLLVAPLSGHHATLLRDTVRGLLPAHDVYITDWRDARMIPVEQGAFHLHDYVHYLQDFMRRLGPDLHVIAVCQPTAPVLAAIALMSSDADPLLPLSMTLMGGPVDARCSPTEVNHLATQKALSWFENNVIYTVPANYPGFGRKVYPGFLQHAGFVAMNLQRHAQSHWDFYLHLCEGDNESAEAHRAFYDEYSAVLDMPADYYLETIDTIFQNFRLAKGTWTIDDQQVAPRAITQVALLTIEGELDDISGVGQTHAAHDLCINIPPDKKKRFTAMQCGHYGIFSGRRWRNIICPKVAQFIRDNHIVHIKDTNDTLGSP